MINNKKLYDILHGLSNL